MTITLYLFSVDALAIKPSAGVSVWSFPPWCRRPEYVLETDARPASVVHTQSLAMVPARHILKDDGSAGGAGEYAEQSR
jgi:hypothetical protein